MENVILYISPAVLRIIFFKFNPFKEIKDLLYLPDLCNNFFCYTAVSEFRIDCDRPDITKGLALPYNSVTSRES